MYSKNRTQQNDRMNSSQGLNRQGATQGSAGRFNRSNHDTTGFQNYGQDQQSQRQQQGFSGGYQSGGYQSSQNAPFHYGQDDMNSSRSQNSSQWQQHEGPSYTAYGTNGGVYDTTSSTMGRGDANAYGTSSTGYGSSSGMGYGQGQHSDWSRAGSDRMGQNFSENQGYHPTRSMNEGMHKSDSYMSSGMPQSSEQIGSRYYGDQSGQQYGGARSQYGTGSNYGSFGSGSSSQYGSPSYGSQSYGQGSQSYGASQGSYGAGRMDNSVGSQAYGQGSHTSNVWGAPNTQSLYGEHHGKGPKSYRRSDDRVREDVCEALAHHGGIDASEVDVSVAEGVVTLSGTIDSRQMKRMIEETIEHMSGVQDIKNELKVEESSSSKRSSFDTSSTEGSRSLSGSSSKDSSKMSSSTNGRTTASSTSTSATKQ